MPQAKGTMAYPEARNLLERAIDSPKGIQFKMSTDKQAFKMRMNCYTLRSRERKKNERLYEIDHPLYGNSPWDTLELTLLEGGKNPATGLPWKNILQLRKGLSEVADAAITELE